MIDVNNVFTDLFEALLASNHDGIIIYPDQIPQCWKARYSGNIPGFESMTLEEILYDLEALGISLQIPEFGNKETLVDYPAPDNSIAKLKVKYTRTPNVERVVITRNPSKKK